MWNVHRSNQWEWFATKFDSYVCVVLCACVYVLCVCQNIEKV